MSEVDKNVIPSDMCIGCGGCAFVDPEHYKIDFDKHGMLKASLTSAAGISDKQALVDKVCPFTGAGRDENQIRDELFPSLPTAPYIGAYLGCYVGHVVRSPYRALGSSGGMAKWLLSQLIDKKIVDYVIQVTASDKPGILYEYQVFESKEKVLEGSRSAYYPISLVEMLTFVRDNPGNYAVSAVPCFSKALRNLMKEDKVIGVRIKFIVGIICGHLKSSAFAKLFALQMGVQPEALEAIDFRGKLPGRMANDKGVKVTDKDGYSPPVRSSKELFGGNWGHNLFKYKACDYCDDVVAETADCAIGDAWLPGIMEDYKGSNVLVIRHPVLQELIDEGISSGDLALNPVTPKQVSQSQMGGIRHRTEGLALRLHDDTKAGHWVPQKRIKPSDKMSKLRKNIYRSRVALRDTSHEAFSRCQRPEDVEVFRQQLAPLIRRLEYRPLWRRALSPLKTKFQKIVSKL